ERRELLDIGDRRLEYECAALGDDHHETLKLKTRERLPHWRAAHAHRQAEAVFRKRLTEVQLRVDDGVADALLDDGRERFWKRDVELGDHEQILPQIDVCCILHSVSKVQYP